MICRRGQWICCVLGAKLTAQRLGALYVVRGQQRLQARLCGGHEGGCARYVGDASIAAMGAAFALACSEFDQ